MCTDAFAETTSTTAQHPFPLFVEATKFGEINSDGVGSEDKKFQSFTFPSLSYVNGVLVVFAQAKKNDKEPKKCDIVEGYFQLNSNNNLAERLGKITEDKEWKRRLVTKNADNICAESPTALVNQNDIYVFFKNSSIKGDNNLEYWVGKGSIANEKKQIVWEPSFTDLKKKFELIPKDLPGSISISSGGSGIIVNDSLVVPVMYSQKSGDELFSTIINASKNDGKEWKLVLSQHSVGEKYPANVEWDKKLIMMTSSTEGFLKIYESTDMGTTWKEALGFLSRMWGNNKKNEPKKYISQCGFITAKIGNGEKNEVILVTHPIETKEKYTLHLWMTDYQRVYDAGAISAECDQSPSSTLLFAEENLFVAYETSTGDKSSINLAHLKGELTKIKEVQEKWTKQDKNLSNSCFAADGNLTTGAECTDNKIPVNGIVGYLSGNYEDNNKWVDEYWCVNATVTRDKGTITNLTNGLRFSGVGTGVTWQVGAQGQNRQFHFVNYGFTLVATVKIDGETSEKNSILGIGIQSNNKKTSIGVWCNEGKWCVADKKSNVDALTTTTVECVQQGIYQVVLTLNNKDVSVFINGNQLKELSQKSIDVENQESITHFYFGAENKAEGSIAEIQSHVTVTNVFLYNRLLDNTEINNLKKNIKTVKVKQTPDKSNGIDTQQPEKNNTGGSGSDQQPPPPFLPGTNENEEKATSPSRTEDGGVGGGVRVFSLLLAVLCVSAPLLHL